MVRPHAFEFAMIYRSAMEVHWEPETQCLYSPTPREWGYLRWFQQIAAAVSSEYGAKLVLTSSTLWSNVAPDLKGEIQQWSASQTA